MTRPRARRLAALFLVLGVLATAAFSEGHSPAAAQSEAAAAARAEAHSPEGRAQAQATAQVDRSVLVALTAEGELLRFSSAAPGTLLGRAPVTGLVPGDVLVGMDFHPSSGQLYAVGRRRLYTVNPATGVAAPAGPESPAQPGERPLNDAAFGVAFLAAPVGGEPVADRLLTVIGSTNDFAELTLGPGGCRGCAYGAWRLSDTGPGPVPAGVVAAAYLTLPNAPGWNAIRVIDSERDTLRWGMLSRNIRQFGDVGPLGVDATEPAGFDIAQDNSVAYAALAAPGARESTLYTVDLSTGQAREVGVIGGGQLVHALAIAPASLPSTTGMRLPATGAGPMDAPDDAGAGTSGVAAAVALGALAAAGAYALMRRPRLTR